MTDSFDRYWHLVAVLLPDTVPLVMDIIEVTPTQQPYETLKERLLSHFKMSVYERLVKLFTIPDLGHREPSAMLAAMLEVRNGLVHSLACFCTACLGSSGSCWSMRISPTWNHWRPGLMPGSSKVNTRGQRRGQRRAQRRG
jgi:hypothetical protein